MAYYYAISKGRAKRPAANMARRGNSVGFLAEALDGRRINCDLFDNRFSVTFEDAAHNTQWRVSLDAIPDEPGNTEQLQGNVHGIVDLPVANTPATLKQWTINRPGWDAPIVLPALNYDRAVLFSTASLAKEVDGIGVSEIFKWAKVKGSAQTKKATRPSYAHAGIWGCYAQVEVDKSSYGQSIVYLSFVDSPGHQHLYPAFRFGFLPTGALVFSGGRQWYYVPTSESLAREIFDHLLVLAAMQLME